MVAVLTRPLPAIAGSYAPSPGYPTPVSATVLLPNDPRGEISDFALIAERSERRLRFTRPIAEDFQSCAPGARYRLQTDATQITFSVASSNLVGRYDARNYFAVVLVNGVEAASFDSRTGGYVLNLVGATSRLVELIWPYADSMDLLSVSVNTGATFSAPAARPSGILAAAGDSITQGFLSSKTTDTWAFKLAAAEGRRLINLGDGGDKAMASYASGLIGTGADRVTYLIGYNDFDAQTPLATFQAAVEGWINNAESALPSAQIYVISPIYSPNVKSITLAQYRTAMVSAVAAAGGPNVTYVNGLSIMTNSNDRLNGDLVHPNDLGASEIAASLAAIVA